MTDDTADHEEPYALLQRGEALIQGRHYAQAAIVLQRAAQAEPGKGSILEALGRAYFNSGQPEQARATFEALLELDPSAHYAHFALGESLRKLGRLGEARTHIRLATVLDPSSDVYRRAFARIGPGEPPGNEPPGNEPPGNEPPDMRPLDDSTGSEA